jgi:hypothetical protein
LFALKREAKYKQTILGKRPKVIISAISIVMLFSVSSLSTAQQEVVISGRGFDPLLNYSGVPDQIYEAWHGTILLDADTSDENGDYELKISSDGVSNSNNVSVDYKLSSNYPEPFSEQTKLNLVIPNNTTIKIDIFNILGQRVTRQLSFSVFPGNFWMDIKGIYANGIYFVRVTSPEHSMVEKTIRLDEHSNFPQSQLNKQVAKNSYNEPLITLTQVSSVQLIKKVLANITMKVRSIGLIQYEDDEVITDFASQILHFARIRN